RRQRRSGRGEFMKNFSVLAVFLVSVLAFGATLKAKANHQPPRIVPALSVPEPLESWAARKGDGGTRDEEELKGTVDERVVAGQVGLRVR
ncbi:MAG: hypothetical protein ACYC8T_27195, partial [Myxococcaceae bacterium]